MNKEKYVIVDVHPRDAWYDKKDELIGKIVTIPSKLDNEYRTLEISGEYGSGNVRFEEDVKGMFLKGELTNFFAVQIAPLSEIKNK